MIDLSTGDRLLCGIRRSGTTPPKPSTSSSPTSASSSATANNGHGRCMLLKRPAKQLELEAE